MNGTQPRSITVFLASPGDLEPERKAFREKLEELNSGFGAGAQVIFVPKLWEDVLAATGRRVQDLINREVDASDLLILALNRRWGRPAPDSESSSYTEEEFRRGLKRWTKKKSPEVIVLFKNVDEATLVDPGRQLKRVLAFRKELEVGRRTLSRAFGTEDEFAQEVDKHLRAFAQGRWQEIDRGTRRVDLSKAAVSALDRARRSSATRVKRTRSRAKAGEKDGSAKKLKRVSVEVNREFFEDDQAALTLARAAVDAASDGRVQDATILFAKASEGTTNVSVLGLAADFFKQIGDLGNYSRLIRRLAASTRDRMKAAQHYISLLPKGWMASTVDQLTTQMLSQFPAEIAEEMRSLMEEVWGSRKLEEFTVKTMVKHYSARELEAFCRFTASPEAQSILKKQPLIVQESMAYGAVEVQRAFARRYPEALEENPELFPTLPQAPAALPQLPALAPAERSASGGPENQKVPATRKPGRRRPGI